MKCTAWPVIVAASVMVMEVKSAEMIVAVDVPAPDTPATLPETVPFTSDAVMFVPSVLKVMASFWFCRLMLRAEPIAEKVAGAMRASNTSRGNEFRGLRGAGRRSRTERLREPAETGRRKRFIGRVFCLRNGRLNKMPECA